MTATPFQPEYIPPHLQGRVSDLRREVDGRMSFFDPQAAKGTFGPEASRQFVAPDVFRSTFDPATRSNGLVDAVQSQYGMPQPNRNYATMLRDWTVDKAHQGLDWGTSSQGKSVGTAGLISALAGGVGGMLGEDGSPGKSLLYALLAGGAGAGLTALGQHYNNRREGALKQASFADTDLLSLLSQNFSIPDYDKQRYTNCFSRLSYSEKNELAKLLRMSAGAAAGALIARYLSGKGLLTTIAGGMLGAFVGRATGPQQSYNALGQLSILNLQR